MNPTEAVKKMKGERIRIETKGGEVLEGELMAADDYINLLLADTSEIEDGESTRRLGDVVVRGNNLVFVRPTDR